VVQHALDDVRQDAELGHARGGGTTEGRAASNRAPRPPQAALPHRSRPGVASR
jgi:hypothetical protein